MKLNELTAAELQALVGLLKLVVRADGRLTDEELSDLEAFGQEAGLDAWVDAVDEVDRSLHTRDAVLQHAARIERAEVRDEIVGRLRQVAGTDGITEQEAAVIDEVRGLWGAP